MLFRVVSGNSWLHSAPAEWISRVPAARATQLRLPRTSGCLVRYGRLRPPATNGRDSRAGSASASAGEPIAHAHRRTTVTRCLWRRGLLGCQLRLAPGPVRATLHDGRRFGGNRRAEARDRRTPLRRRAEDRDHRRLWGASAHRDADGRTRGVLRHLRRSGMPGTHASAGRTDKLAREQPLRRRLARIERRWFRDSTSVDE
jgi:hypothetical protein